MRSLRIGIGFDTHPLAITGEPLIVGGLSVSDEFTSVGHSDGDALVHALVDAILGATGKGNIGEWFPTNDLNKNRKSINFLTEIYDKIIHRRYEIINIDTVVVLSKVRLSGRIEEMKKNISEVLHIDPCRISIKPKSGNDTMNETITVHAVCLLRKLEG